MCHVFPSQSIFRVSSRRKTNKINPTNPMVHPDRGGVLPEWSQAQQHMTSLPKGRLIGGWLWQASRVELAPDQPQRSFAPCGSQRDTPTNSRKQTTESRGAPRRSAAALFPRYIIIARWYYSKDFCNAHQHICSAFLHKTALHGQTHTEATGKQCF